MAKANDYLCDKCGERAFYDDSVIWPDDIEVKALCRECAKTHTIKIVERPKAKTYRKKPGPKMKVDADKAQEAVSMLQGGKLFNKTAEAIGVSPNTLRIALMRQGLRLPYQRLGL